MLLVVLGGLCGIVAMLLWWCCCGWFVFPGVCLDVVDDVGIADGVVGVGVVVGGCGVVDGVVVDVVGVDDVAGGVVIGGCGVWGYVGVAVDVVSGCGDVADVYVVVPAGGIGGVVVGICAEDGSVVVVVEVAMDVVW